MNWSEKAEADLDDIWNYTERKWGEEQADKYLAGLNAAIGSDRPRKLRARPIDFVAAGLWRMRYVRHYLYFRYTDEDIHVERVLHDSMDETLHIP